MCIGVVALTYLTRNTLGKPILTHEFLTGQQPRLRGCAQPANRNRLHISKHIAIRTRNAFANLERSTHCQPGPPHRPRCLIDCSVERFSYGASTAMHDAAEKLRTNTVKAVSGCGQARHSSPEAAFHSSPTGLLDDVSTSADAAWGKQRWEHNQALAETALSNREHLTGRSFLPNHTTPRWMGVRRS